MAQGLDPASVSKGGDIEDEKKRFVGNALLVLYNDKFVTKAEKMLQDGENTIEDMADIGAGIAMRIYQGAMDKGTQIDPRVIIEGGFELMQQIGEFANAVGAKVSDEDIETAYLSAADKLRTRMIDQGHVDEEELAAEGQRIAGEGDPEAVRAAAQRVVSNRQQRRL